MRPNTLGRYVLAACNLIRLQEGSLLDTDAEARKFKWLMITCVQFIASVVMSWSALRFRLFSSETDARLLGASLVDFSRRQDAPQLRVQYQSSDNDGQVRKEVDLVPTTWGQPDGGMIPIQYIAGSPGVSRLLGQTRMFLVYTLLVIVLVMAYQGFRFWRFYQS